MEQTQATVEKIDEEAATLNIIDNDGGNVTLPAIFLPSNIKEGDTVMITISLNGEKNIAPPQAAKDILNEILKSEEEK